MKRKNRVDGLFNKNAEVDALVVKSPADIAYLVGLVFPYPDQSPFSAALVAAKGKDKYTLVLPAEWECTLKTWKGSKKVYSVNEGSPTAAFRAALKAAMESLIEPESRVGIDYASWTAGEMNFLKAGFPNLNLISLDAFLNAERELKSADEIKNIRDAAHIADRGIIGALNHLEGTINTTGYTKAEFLERIRVHAIEFGANCVGHLNLSTGKEGHSWYTPITDLSLIEEGHTIRVDYSVAYNGCWASCSRMFFTGKPDADTEKAYADNMRLKNFALSILKPGIRITEFCEAVRLKAEEYDIDLLLDEGLGHGVGNSEHEMPYLGSENEEVLKKGMVIALDIKTIGSENEMIHSVDIYALTEDGNEKISDFRDWDSLYLINGVRSSH